LDDNIFHRFGLLPKRLPFKICIMIAEILIVIIVIILLALIPLFRRKLRETRRQALRANPFPQEWRDLIEKNIPFYKLLPDDLKNQLHGHIQVFLAEKHFEGAGGLEMTDEIRLTVAAQACILLLNHKPVTYYPRLVSIIVYPHEYSVNTPKFLNPGQYIEDSEVHLGESWHSGAIVLSWDHVKQGARDIHDGHNLVFHEFAHQLDEESGNADGVPVLSQGSSYIAWARVMGKDYKDLRDRVIHGAKSAMDAYGATNEAEFFAVATECFFEKPKQLKRQYADLYEELKSFYKQDPEKYEKAV